MFLSIYESISHVSFYGAQRLVSGSWSAKESETNLLEGKLEWIIVFPNGPAAE